MIFKTKFLEVKEQYHTHEEIYTHGSNDGEKVASAAILDDELYQFRLPNNSSIFFAIDLALSHIEQDAYWRYIIFTDSLSAMQTLEGEKTDNPLVVILKGEGPPECIPCNSILSVKHLLIECTDLAPYRDRYFHVGSLKMLFDTVKLKSLFEFLKEVNLFKKI